MNTTGDEAEGSEVRKKRRPTKVERERILAEWAASGRTQEEMAALTGWSRHTLLRWRQVANGASAKKTAKAMLDVPPPPGRFREVWAAEIIWGRETMSVRLSAGCRPNWAGDLVRELKSC